MAKQWTMVAHSGYFASLRGNVPNPDIRYKVTVGLWDQLQETDDPTQGADLVRAERNRYSVVIEGYTVYFELPEDRPNDIDVLEVR